MSEGILIALLAVTWVGLGVWYIRERSPWSGIPLFLSMIIAMAITSIVKAGWLHG